MNGIDSNSSPFVQAQPHSATLAVRHNQNSRLKNMVGGGGTGTGFSQIGNDESGLTDSDAKEFLRLEQRTYSEVTPREVD